MEDKLAVARRWVELYNERSHVAEFVSLLDPDAQCDGARTMSPHGARRLRAYRVE
jgi:hypothetical protein